MLRVRVYRESFRSVVSMRDLHSLLVAASRYRIISKSFLSLFQLASVFCCLLFIFFFPNVQQHSGQLGCVSIGRQGWWWPMEAFFLLCMLTAQHLQVGRLESQPWLCLVLFPHLLFSPSAHLFSWLWSSLCLHLPLLICVSRNILPSGNCVICFPFYVYIWLANR